jgi:Fe-S cluster assembly protein SufD
MADIHPMKTAAEAALAEAYGALRARLPADDRSLPLRDTAFESFHESGLPHRRIEEWKYTDLRALMREVKPLAQAPDSKALDRARLASRVVRDHAHLRLTVVDGVFSPALSDVGLLPAGVRFVSLAEALSTADPFVVETLGMIAPDNAALSLNAAFMTDGVVLVVDDGVRIELPVLLQHVQSSETGHAVYSRSLIVLGKRSAVTLVDCYEGFPGAANQTNAAIEVHLGEGARLDRVSVQGESLETLHLSSLVVSLGPEAELASFALAAGSAVARNQLFVTVAGKNTKVLLSGASLLAGRRHSDTTLVVDHAKPGGESREIFHSVLDGGSRAVFQGKIIVRPGAQKTDGRMMSRAVMLSNEAEIDNKPELEIFADDVQCAHGATCGELDDDLLFYLKARGIPQAEAEAILLRAFVGEAVETVADEVLRASLMEIADLWLAARS